MKYIISIILCFLFALYACNNNGTAVTETKSNISFVQNISTADLTAIQAATPEVIFLDVRTPAETSAGIIDGALIMDFRAEDFKDKLETLDKSESYIVYCKSGGRSSNASKIMQQIGFKNIYNLEGGYTAYVSLQ